MHAGVSLSRPQTRGAFGQARVPWSAFFVSTDPAPYFAVAVERAYSALRVTGPRYWIDFAPSWGDGRVRVSVVAKPNGELPSPSRLTSGEDLVFSYLPDEIYVDRERLSCHAAQPFGAPYYRPGFVLDLDSGMSDAVRSAVATAGVVSRHAEHVCERLALQFFQPGESRDTFHWLLEDAVAAIFRAVLDGEEPATAVKATFAHRSTGVAGNERAEAFKAALVAAMDQQAVA